MDKEWDFVLVMECLENILYKRRLMLCVWFSLKKNGCSSFWTSCENMQLELFFSCLLLGYLSRMVARNTSVVRRLHTL